METTSYTLLEVVMNNPRSSEWERFDRLYRPMVERWARANGFQPADSEDITQEVLSRMQIQLHTYNREKGSFRSWLFVVTKSVGHDFRRRVATRAFPAADGLSGVEDQFTFKDPDDVEYKRQLIEGALDLIRGEMEDKTVTKFIKVKLEGNSVEEVAAEMGVTPQDIYSAIHRVRTKLKEILNGFLED